MDKDVVVMAMGMEATMEEVRSIHRRDTCSLVCDMLKLVDMWEGPGACIAFALRRWM